MTESNRVSLLANGGDRTVGERGELARPIEGKVGEKHTFTGTVWCQRQSRDRRSFQTD